MTEPDRPEIEHYTGPSEVRQSTLFYSWQSDLPDATNRALIRRALHQATSQDHEAAIPNVRFLVDEATRGEPGSPDIPSTIFRKIASADIFVCDVTLINNHPDHATRARLTPNPNVLIELGYAAAILGWSRVIMLFNEAHGELRGLPFDIDRRRIAKYRATEEDVAGRKQKSARDFLSTLLASAIASIVEHDPIRPVMLQPDAAAIRRGRDLRTLNRLLGLLNFEIIDRFASNAPDMFRSSIFDVWEPFHREWCSSLTEFHDTELHRLFYELDRSLDESLSSPSLYESLRDGRYVLRSVEGESELRTYQALRAAVAKVALTSRSLVRYIQEKYVEVDLQEHQEAYRRCMLEAQQVLKRDDRSSGLQEDEPDALSK